MVIKTDDKGNTKWSKTFDSGGYDAAYCIKEVQGDGYVLVGRMGYLPCFMKISSLGTDRLGSSSKIYSSIGNAVAQSIQETSDDGFIVAGSLLPPGGAFLLKIDHNGFIEWSKTYDNLGACGNTCCVLKAQDEGYFMMVDYGPTLVKTDSHGTEECRKVLGNQDRYSRGVSIKPTSDGYYIMVGILESSPNGCDVWLIKVDSLGNVAWSKSYGGPRFDEGKSVAETSDGSFIVVGNTQSFSTEETNTDIYLLKVDAEGNIASIPNNEG